MTKKTNNLVRIKTAKGFYFVEGRGYMRLSGSKLNGWVLCPSHADKVMECLKLIADRVRPSAALHPERMEFLGWAHCQECMRHEDGEVEPSMLERAP